MKLKTREQYFELRSENVRSVVGQIPPTLVRYGIIILFAVLLILFGIAYFMPYKQVYSGTITFYDVSEPSMPAYITFVNDKDLTNIEEPTSLTIHLEIQNLEVQLRSIKNRRDILNRHLAFIEVNKETQNNANLNNSTFDFTLVESSDNLLSHFLPKRKTVKL